jgi:hypothetical protein
MNDTVSLEPRSLALIDMGEADQDTIQMFVWGEVRHPKMPKFTVDKAFAEQMVASFGKLKEHGYYPPIIADHGRGHEPGTALGIVLDVFINESGVAARVEYAKGVREEVRAGRRPYQSPSFYTEYTHPHTGEVLKYALRELSFATVPVQKNLPPMGGYYSLSEIGWATNTQEAVMADQPETPETAPVDNMEDENPEMDLAEEYAKLSERMTALEEQVRKMMEGPGDEPEEVPSSEPVANAEASADERIAALERTIALKDAEINVRSVLPTAPMQEVTDLAESIVDSPKRGARLLSLAERAYKAEPTTNTIQQPMGAPGASPAEPVDFAEAWDACASELGTTDAGSIGRLMERLYPHLTGRTLIG